MAELKTKVNSASVTDFLDKVTDAERRKDCDTVSAMMQKVTGEAPKMWGASLVGFGAYKYTYASGHSGEWLIIGFSPRKSDLTLYIMPGFTDHQELMDKLGKHKTGKSCLYIKKLADVDLKVLEKLMKASVAAMKKDRVKAE